MIPPFPPLHKHLPGNTGTGPLVFRTSAFTLIEIMASIALLSLVVVLLAGMAREVTSAWVVNTGQTESQQSARAISDMITRDLAGTLLPIETSSQTSLQFKLNPAISADSRNPDAIFFQAPVATDTRRGDIAQVGYFVRWVTEGNRPVARLCRFYVDRFTIDETGNTPLPIYAKPDGWISDIDDPIYGAPADSDHEYRGLLAENVIGFWVRPIEIDASGNAKVITNSTYDSRDEKTLPAQVEVSFVMIDSRYAQRIDPSLKTAIQGAATSAASAAGADLKTSPADQFLASANGDGSPFKSLIQGLRGYTTRVSLSNSIRNPSQSP